MRQWATITVVAKGWHDLLPRIAKLKSGIAGQGGNVIDHRVGGGKAAQDGLRANVSFDCADCTTAALVRLRHIALT
jgi:hypothetical protein